MGTTNEFMKYLVSRSSAKINATWGLIMPGATYKFARRSTK